METSLSLYVAFALGLSYLFYHFIVHPGLISPLARIPAAHPIASFTPLWMQRQAKKSRGLQTLFSVHNKYGPIVRLGPSEVSVVSQEGLKKIYIAGLDKHPWYQQTFYAYGHQNLVATLDHKTHSAQKKMIAKLYTKTYLQRSEPLAQISKHIVLERLYPFLRKHAGQDVNVVPLFEWIGVDFITAYDFGQTHGTNFLQDEASRNSYFGEYTRKRKIVNAFPEQLIFDTCSAVLAGQRDIKDHASQNTVFLSLYTQMTTAVDTGSLAVQHGEILERCASEVFDHVIATQAVNSITWTYIVYRLSLDPDMQTRLRTELQGLQHSLVTSEPLSSLPSPANIDRLPILDAVIMETLRLHAGNPSRMRRVVPAGGIELHGVPIPSGTTVSTNAYCLHRNADVFPQPLKWRPERWLNEASRAEGMRWFWAFGSGPRMCIGNHFAMQVIKLVVAAIYSQYTTIIVDDRGIEQSDSYNSGPIGKRLILRFEAVVKI